MTIETYIKERTNELRAKYKDTGKEEFLYRVNELQRLSEFVAIAAIGSPRNPRPGEGRDCYSHSPD